MEFFQYTKNREEIRNLLRPYMEKQLIIPYVGSGFSKKVRTRSGGWVPSGWDLQKKMIEMLQMFASYSRADAEYYNDKNLNDFADIFFMDMKDRKELREAFQAYMKKNFSKTFDLSDEKKKFLNAGWNSLYTLNYDDAIESYLEEYSVIYPYDTQGEFVKNGEKCIYKIHGDVNRYLNTGDLKYIILGKTQYIKTLKDEDNNDMMKTLQNNFYSKSAIFIGCSLTNELDLMYTAELQLSRKSAMNSDHIIVYVRFVDDNVYELSRQDENQLKMYGVTHIINVNEQEVYDLYQDLYSIGTNAKKEDLKDGIDKFCNYQIVINNGINKEKDLDFLRSQGVEISKNYQITLPSYFISRNKIQEDIIQPIRSASDKEGLKHVYFLVGQRVSGKTFGLLGILKDFQVKKVFYFPSDVTLSTDALNKIYTYNDACFLFDENVLERDDLLDNLLANLECLRQQNLFFVVAINRSDGKFFQYYLEHNGTIESNIKIVNLPSVFTNDEIQSFNDKIKHLSLIDYKPKGSILDYLYQFLSKDLQSGNESFFAHRYDEHFLTNEKVSEIKALIVLATEMRVSSQKVVELEIDESMYSLMTKYNKFIQKYYTVQSIEKDGYSGFKFVLNSSSWAIRALSTFANDRNNHAAIAKAYRSIFLYYKKIYKDGKIFHQIVRKYGFLDDIQMLFCNRKFGGSLQLPDRIYEEIRPLLSDEFQFLHQSAKCKLQLARMDSLKKNEKAKYLENANRDITRAYDIASEYSYKNIDYTLLHMSLTEALIVTNYIFNGINSRGRLIDLKTQQERAIDAYYRVFCEFGYVENQFEKKDIKDVDRFIKYMINEKQISSNYESKLSNFVTEFRNMRIS